MFGEGEVGSQREGVGRFGEAVEEGRRDSAAVVQGGDGGEGRSSSLVDEEGGKRRGWESVSRLEERKRGDAKKRRTRADSRSSFDRTGNPAATSGRRDGRIPEC